MLYCIYIVDAILQSFKPECPTYWLSTVMFSPVELQVLAVAGKDGTVLYDIRNLKQ